MFRNEECRGKKWWRRSVAAHEVHLQEEAGCEEVIWCKLVPGHRPKNVIDGVVYRCPIVTKQNNEKMHNIIREMSKGDDNCIIIGVGYT